MRSYQNSPSNSIYDLLSLEGKTALVVGGSGYLGKEITKTLIELGATVFIASRDYENNSRFASELNRTYGKLKAIPQHVDITQPVSVSGLIQEITEKTNGVLDILVNSGWSGKKNSLESITINDWNYDLDVCLTGVFSMVKASLELLKKSSGIILNISSMYGHIAPDYRVYVAEEFTNPPSYGAAKAGVIQLTRYLASFLAPHGIRVNSISPGPFPFPETQISSPEFIELLSEKNLLNRIGVPEEIRGAVALLCSSASSFITGQNLCVDGGWSVW